MPVRGIVLDAVGTLIYARPAVAAVYAAVGRRFGSRKDERQVARAFRRAFDAVERADRAGNLATSEQREENRWRGIVAEVLDGVSDAEGCSQALFEHFAQPESWAVYPDAEEALAALFEGGWPVAIASNFDARLRRICRGHALLSQCHPVVISSEVDYRKPHRALFQAVEEQMGISAEALLHVGDDLENDYQGALRAGWQSLWLVRNPATAKTATEGQALRDNQIHSLSELVVRLHKQPD